MNDILTPAQTCGPLFGFALFPEGLNQSADAAAPGTVVIEGCIHDGAGESVGYGSWIEFWSEGQACRARALDGRFRVVMAKPGALDVPGVGTLAPCLNVSIFTRGLALPLATRLYFPDETALNEADPVMARVPPELRDRLVAVPGSVPDTLRFDIHLQGPREAVFFALSQP